MIRITVPIIAVGTSFGILAGVWVHTYVPDVSMVASTALGFSVAALFNALWALYFTLSQ